MTQPKRSGDSASRRKPSYGIVCWLLGALLVVDGIWFASPWISDYLQARRDRKDAEYAAQMTERQSQLETMLKSLQLPIFGRWEQVAPMFWSLAQVQEPERNPAPEMTYSLWSGETSGWVPMPQYVDGYPNPLSLKGIPPAQHEFRPTVILARTITSPEAMTIPIFLGCDGGFVLWLNGESLLLSDARTESFQPGQEAVPLLLKKGENRLVLKIRLEHETNRFFFQPDYGEEQTERLMSELEVKFPVRYPRSVGYRSRAVVASTSTEEQYYRLTEFEVPQDIFLEGGGLGFLPDGKLAVGTRRGFVYLVDGLLKGTNPGISFQQHASGLHEVLGLNVNPEGRIDVAQRGSVVRLKDRDSDGQIDTIQNLNNGWGLSGNYHEYAMDLERDPKGNYYTSLSLSDSGGGTNAALVPDRGWVMQITPDRKLVPWCFGLRCANGLGWNVDGDLFATDNQGQWVPASPVYHVQRDHYFGNPASLNHLGENHSAEARRRAKLPPTPPAVWLPYEEFCMSATDIVCDRTDGRFGPFDSQMFVGDMMKGTIVRVALEKVAGEYQGACFLFRRGVGAVNRMTFGPDQRLFLTRAARGWGGGGRGEGLACLEFTGEVPFEMKSMHLRPDGFDVHFTLPIGQGAEQFLSEIRLEQFRYHYWERYGSPKIDQELLTVSGCELSSDRTQLSIRAEGIKTGHICHLKMPRINAANGRVLLHPDAFYTVNHLIDTPTNETPAERAQTGEPFYDDAELIHDSNEKISSETVKKTISADVDIIRLPG